MYPWREKTEISELQTSQPTNVWVVVAGAIFASRFEFDPTSRDPEYDGIFCGPNNQRWMPSDIEFWMPRPGESIPPMPRPGKRS